MDLTGKFALLTGITNRSSIAFGVAEALKKRGARLALGYYPLKKEGYEKKLRHLIDELAFEHIVPMDVSDVDSVKAMFQVLGSEWGRLDIMVHSLASAKREELGGRYSDISEEGFSLAHRISAYSLIELTRHARTLMKGGGSILTLSYVGAQRACRNYNVMGAAKASLEASVRYLAMELGPENIRVNAVSAGPIRTLSAAGITNFFDLLHNAKEKSPLGRNITQKEVGDACVFLASKASSGITGQTIFVDGGYNIYG